MKALLLAAALLAAPLPAFAADVALKASPASHGAAITLGDLFEGTGAASSEIVAPAMPAGQETVLNAAQVQVAARRAGLTWDNPTGQRRVLVASLGSAAPRAAAMAGERAPARARAASHHSSQSLAYARNIKADRASSPASFPVRPVRRYGRHGSYTRDQTGPTQ